MCVFVLLQNQATPYQRPAEMQKNPVKNQMWTGVLGITLVEGQDLPQYGQGDIYVRFRLGDQKYKSKVGHFFKSLSVSPTFPFLMLFSFYICSLYFKSFFPVPISYFRASLSQLVSVTHLHLGSLVHGRGSSLDWARLPLTSPCASGAGLHCLHLHTQHALFI